MKTYTEADLDRELQDIFLTREFSYRQYTEELLAFQSAAARIVMDEDTNAHYRLSDIIARLESMAAESHISSDPSFRNDIIKLRQIDKEISISMAGKRAEDRVDYILGYINRDHTYHFRNVNVSDGSERSEIDQIILTDCGLILLEVKGTKSNMTIGCDGRLMYGNEISYHNDSIIEKLDKKRRLLEHEIRERLQKKGQIIQLHTDCRLVLSTPRNSRIHVTNNCPGLKWNFANQSAHIVNNYAGPVKYSAQQLEILKEIISDITAEPRPFTSNLDMPEVRKCFKDAVLMLNPHEVKKIEDREIVPILRALKKYLPVAAGIAASMVLISSAAISNFVSIK